MNHRLRVLVTVSSGLLLVGPLFALEIKGKVVETRADAVRIETGSEYAPNVGDKVEIFFEIPGLGERVLVARGAVAQADRQIILVRIEQASGKLAKGQLAEITSTGPRVRESPIPAEKPKREIERLARFSDSFDRADSDGSALGLADLALGGSGAHFYLPLWPAGGRDAGRPIGARIVDDALENNGLDFGGVQFAAQPGGRGEDLGQDLNIKLDLLVPTDTSGHITQAGPYFRSRAAAAGDGLIGGTSAGYWIQLHSTGDVKVKRLNPAAVVASSEKRASFDPTRFHTLEIAAQGPQLQVALDGKLLTFTQDGTSSTTVSIPPAWEGPPAVGANQGAAGISFGAEENRGAIGGQRADNLVISPFRSLVGLSVQENASPSR